MSGQKKHILHDSPPLGDITSPRDPHVLPITTIPLPPMHQGEMKPMVVEAPKQNTLRGNRKPMRHLDESTANAEYRGRVPCHHDHHDNGGNPNFFRHPGPDGEDWDEEDRHPWERRDKAYSGELLWGPRGDSCMYDNFDNLSEQCQSAILDVYALRSEYMEEEEHRGVPPGVVFFFFIIITVLVSVCNRRRMAKRYQEQKAIYDAMQANPELKAQMQSASGVVMEAPVAPGGNFVFYSLKVLGCFLVSFLVIHIAALVTMVVVENTLVTDESGNVSLPNPMVPFFTFFGTLIGLVSFVLCLTRRRCKRNAEGRRGSSTSAPATPSLRGTSVAPSPTVAHSSTPAPQFSVVEWFNRRFSSPVVASDYAVLPASSSHGGAQEMVVFTPTAPVPNTQAVVLTTSSFPHSTAKAVTPMNVI